MSESSLKFELDSWQFRGDGLIFFDPQGNFKGCSAEIEKLAGSAEAVREAVEAARGREFAESGASVSIAAGKLRLPDGSPAPAEVRCVRTSAGIVAAVGLAQCPACLRGELLRDILCDWIADHRAIAAHLHAELTQDLVAPSLSLSGLHDESNGRLADALAHLERCCRGVRVVSYVLAPPSFLDGGLIETIGWFIGVLWNDAGVNVELHAASLRVEPPPEIKELFFAALQHMAAAAIRAPRPANIRLRIAEDEEALRMRIDCGCRPHETPFESRLIRERARSLGGCSRFMAREDQASLELSIPRAAAV